MIDVGQRVDQRPYKRGATFRQFLPYILASLDACLILAALVLAYWTRYSLKIGPRIHEQLAFTAYRPLAFLLVVIMMPVLLMNGAYRPRLSREIVDEFGGIFSAATISVAAIVVITAMAQQYLYSRGVIVYVWLLLIVLLSIGRGLYRTVQRVCHRHGIGVRRVLVVGASDVGKMVMQNIMNRPDLGYHLVGFIEHRPQTRLQNFGRFRALGLIADIPTVVDKQGIDEVIVALPASAHEEVWPILSLCDEQGVALKLVPDLFEMSLSRVEVDDIGGIPLLDVQEQALRRVARAVKRAMDIVIASLVLVLAAPLLGLMALIIRLESPGPALLGQVRIGADERPFRCYKLRTMRWGAEDLQPVLQGFNESDGPLFKMRDDPRCTPFGRRIRRWSLDELPQVWNIVKGEMSLVGPRPPLPVEVQQYEERHKRRLEIKPGLTGIWQVSGRSDLPFDEMVMMDIYYVDNWSLSLDVKILIRTILAVTARHGAY